MDYAATTPLDPRVFEVMKPYFTQVYGNAESVNTFGLEARGAVEESRKKLAEAMNADFNEVIFTGNATEANNMVVKGHAFHEGKERTHIAISTIEHSCVLKATKWLEEKGYRVTYLPVDNSGSLDMERLEEALRNGVTLVSVIHGSNEIGTIQPIDKIGSLCREHGVLFHTDAAQTFGKIPVDVKSMNIDLMTVNAHKLYGPKGVGALFIRRGVELDPLLHGGEHEFGLRAGTHNVPSIVGFAKAVELRAAEMAEEAERLSRLRDRLIKGILEIEDTRLNGHPVKRLPNNVNICFKYVEGESLVLQLDTEGIAASSGSACSSRSEEASHVLKAIGVNPVDAKGSLRLSLGKYNTDEDVDYVLKVLPRIVKQLRRISPLSPSRVRAN
ncbi:MAG: IscS subfamily cysteine desulfurase [Thaumarchaeota archaeon]|nr:IscS subfamily cysteine desulfurase [Nitrososphaerota archaeon]MCL5318396.1 IscS subfamily cysteine desulfurase [Nitrososphaerota archaeon]